MGVFAIYCYIFLICSVVKSQNGENVTDLCMDDYRDINNKSNIVTLEEYCRDTRCVAKCCQINEVFFNAPGIKGCTKISDVQIITKINITVNYATINIYKSFIEKQVKVSESKIGKDVKFIWNEKFFTKSCRTVETGEDLNYYLIENSTLVLENPNFINRFVYHFNVSDFCVEYFIQMEGEDVYPPRVVYGHTIRNAISMNYKQTNALMTAVACLVSVFFLILVMFVYGVIRELRNLVGIMLMAYVATFAMFSMITAIQRLALHMETINGYGCKWSSPIRYFVLLSSFFWMNVMSLDIWWTFRGMFKSRPIHRRGELNKFYCYALYAWGFPLLVTIVVTVLDNADLRHLPHIFKAHFEHCFYMNGREEEMKYYLYMPILSLLILNTIFFLMTGFNIWRIQKNMNKFANEASKYNNNRNRLGLYLKLSLVMGVTWIFEVVTVKPDWLSTAASFYNHLIGVAIFFIFVFKRRILFMLFKRFNMKGPLVENLQRKYSKSSTLSSDRKRSTVELSTDIRSVEFTSKP